MAFSKTDKTPFQDEMISVRYSDTLKFLKEHYRYINDNKWITHLRNSKLFIKDYTDDFNNKQTREYNWRTTISGSKVKSIEEDTMGLLLYFLGIKSENALNKGLEFIPRLQLLATYGNFREEEILAFFEAGTAYLNDRVNSQAPIVDYHDLFNGIKRDNIQTARFEKVFKGLWLRAFKDTIYEAGTFKTLNIDGLAFNENTELDYVIEIKTKGTYVNVQDVLRQHISQVLFYKTLLKPKKGVLFLFSRGDRSFDFFEITNEVLEAYDEQFKINARIDLFLAVYAAVLNYIVLPTNRLDEVSEVSGISTPTFIKVLKEKRAANSIRFEGLDTLKKLVNKLIDLDKYFKGDAYQETLLDNFKHIEETIKSNRGESHFFDMEKRMEVMMMVRDLIIERIGTKDIINNTQELEISKEQQKERIFG